MKLSIDTQTDSVADIRQAISLLQNVLKNRGYEGATEERSTPSQDRLAKRIAKAKQFEEHQEEVQADIAPAAFDMFSAPQSRSQETASPQQPKDSADDEPKIDIIRY